MQRVAINIVTFNSALNIDACLASVLEQNYPSFSVTVLDNASQDETRRRLSDWKARGVEVMESGTNLYYARAHNRLVARSNSELVLTLNPDVMLASTFLRNAVEAISDSQSIGSVNGKLLLSEAPRLDPAQLKYPDHGLIDSAGLMMYRSRRPYLRGYRQPSRSTCLESAAIFGADGACALYRREMLESVALDGAIFDPDFVMYREDVDLAWRGQIMGWDTVYTPDSVGVHVRGFQLGRERRRMPGVLRRHSVANGWLLLLKHESLGELARSWRHVVPYQARIALGMAATEPSSLPAMLDVLKLMPRAMRHRRMIEAGRKRSSEQLRHWFE
ncbi:MAG: glycosyltransferase family 2 protein [Chloroflexota bacterium]